MTEKVRSININNAGNGMSTSAGLFSSSPNSIIGVGGDNSNSVISNQNSAILTSSAILNSGNNVTTIDSDLGGIFDFNTSSDFNLLMNTSQISTTSNDSISSSTATAGPLTTVNMQKPNIHLTHNIITGNSCRFPKLEECAHFHYERVQLGPLTVRLAEDKTEFLNNTSIASQSLGGDITTISILNPNSSRFFNPSTCWFIIKVIPSHSDPFFIRRSFDNLKLLDEMLHRCVYDRKISVLKDLSQLELKSDDDVDYAVAKYLERFSKIASDSLTCGTVLTWLQLDNKGRRLPLADGDTMRSINTPAVGAAYGVRRYAAQACDEISIEVGDMISVIDMPSPAESIWWRGKKSHLQKSHYEVGFFPQSCVATIGDKVPRHFPLPAPLVGQLDVSPTKPVLRKHGKLIAFFRSFILSRPSRRRLKQSGIYRERVFSCDLSEHLLNSGQEIPMVLKCCAEFIEEFGIVDGIYRLSGITSNIQKLRRAFDEERIPDLVNPEIRQDIHAVSSLLKMYFRELPNPLCTYQLYDNFVEAIQIKSDSDERLRLMKETVLKLPPPHYRTLKYLALHLSKIARHSANTGMTDKNLAIVWAPNLLRSPALESGGVAALRGVGVQAVVTEYLIKNCDLIFDPAEDFNRSMNDQKMDSLTDCESLLVEQREHDQSLSHSERPKSLSAGGPKLISLEEAQERHSRLENLEINNKSMPINTPANITTVGSYIEVGGGPASLPDKYHTVLPVPRGWQKRKTHSWKSLFTRNATRNSNSNNDIKTLNISLPLKQEESNNTKTKSQNHTKIQFSENNVVDCGKTKSNITDEVQRRSIENLRHQRDQLENPMKILELYENGKPIEMCVRSNSIDSLRTAGHSRSVSHDSYFDLLQSPLRGITTCSSREYSELGLNFDREEPEMRIFSESESLVSSPKVTGKENIPPCRRILRARPEEFSSTANSVNPSPKKQPRLNLLSPNENLEKKHVTQTNWDETLIGDQTDESCCKRYKLEDQLSDIQFIDCSTPEHATTLNNNSNTVYTSVQIHNPPEDASLSSKSSSLNDENKDKKFPSKEITLFVESIFENKEKNYDNDNILTRYSYPGIQLGTKRKDTDTALKERFSYPGSGNNLKKNVYKLPDDKVNSNDETKKINPVSNANQYVIDPCKAKNRYSYCDPNALLNSKNPTVNFLFQNASAELNKEKNEIEMSKLNVVTPSSPVQSPRYSLLVGETSSENSSTINTPILEIEPTFQISRKNSGKNSFDDSVLNNLRNCYDTKDFDIEDSRSEFISLPTEIRDISALKRELSLDLDSAGIGVNSKMSIDLTDGSISSNKQVINIPPSPNNSQFTHTSDNTSQSITPSEYGYQNLNRQSYAVSSENSPNFNNYDNFETTFYNNYNNDIKSSSTCATPNATMIASPPPLPPPSFKNNCKASSPIKATISITYNLKSPIKRNDFIGNKNEQEKCCDTTTKLNEFDENNLYKEQQLQQQQQQQQQQKPILETNFDENMVYEQLKFFKSSVSEVNNILLNNGNNDKDNNKDLDICFVEKLNQKQIVPQLNLNLDSLKEVNSNSIILSDEDDNDKNLSQKIDQYNVSSDDILMSDNTIDSLEMDDQNLSLYENVEMRKPPAVYENIDVNSKKQQHQYKLENFEIDHNFITLGNENDSNKEDGNNDNNKKLDADSLEHVDVVQMEKHDVPKFNNSPQEPQTNFSVRELATKFEKSPVEQLPPFDFNVSGNKVFKNNDAVTPPINKNRDNPSCFVRPKNFSNKQQQLNKSCQITRSLDENAFIREFGSKRYEDITKSVQQIEKFEDPSNILSNIRRKSLQEFTRPKSLNPPKRLPGMSNDISDICRMGNNEKISLKLKLDLEKVDEVFIPKTENEIQITPTTENRICLIQNNVELMRQFNTDDDRNAISLSNSNLNNSSLKVLSGVKLDRDRIERIKEERRHQLNEKYRTESFKSKSKTELREFVNKDDKFQSTESLRIKSKSRGDVRILQKEMDNFKGTEIMQFGNRVRRKSDEKNQNTNSDLVNTSEMNLKDDIQIKQLAMVNTTSGTTKTTERKSFEFSGDGGRDRAINENKSIIARNSTGSTRAKISPQFSIKDVTAMFESKSQNQ